MAASRPTAAWVGNQIAGDDGPAPSYGARGPVVGPAGRRGEGLRGDPRRGGTGPSEVQLHPEPEEVAGLLEPGAGRIEHRLRELDMVPVEIEFNELVQVPVKAD